MNDDILKSIPQGSYGAYDEENRRIKEISDELQRLCRLHETQFRNSQKYVDEFEIEQRQTEIYAKANGLWIPFDKIFELGDPGPSGNENDTYVSNTSVFKVNNLLNSKGICKLLGKILLHNQVFPNTAYKLYAFTGYDGRSIMPVLEQERIHNAHPATQIMIDTYMYALGFSKTNQVGRYTNTMYEVWDIIPRNVLIDNDGDIYVIDAELKRV